MRARPRTSFCASLGTVVRAALVILAITAFGTATTRAQAPLSMEELDSLTAPIALYPDTLLAQVLIASTYPAEVAQAGQWAQQNSNLQGAQLDAALDQQTWDPSVRALVQVPTVLQQMNAKMDWTQKLGDAFLAQQADVMDSVQRLRQLAQGAGQLMTTEQQKVVTQGQTIVIEQANPQVMYVPSYNPTTVYGGWPYPSYPPYYWPTPPGYALASGLAWGAGIAIGAAVWGNAFDWGGGNVNVNVNRNNFTNISNDRVNNISNSRTNWQHNSENRRGSNYRDTATREKFGKTNTTAANARRESRGFDQASITNQLQQRGNQGQLGQRGNQGQLGQQRGNQGNQFGQNRSNLERRGQASSFDGVGNGAGTRAASDRGRSSRQSMAQNVSAGGGGSGVNRGGGGARPSAGGGGGRAGGGGARGGGGGGRRR